MSKKLIAILLGVLLGLLFLTGAYFIPPIHDRVAPRLEEQILRIKYALNPPEEVVFVPGEQELATIQPTTTPSPEPSIMPTATLPGPTHTPQPSPTATITPTPLPGLVNLDGVRYEDQHGRWNYCAPANLSMALSFWDWEGNRDVVGPVIKPDPKDKNVMPYEMVDYVMENTQLRAISRVGGNLEMLKRIIAAGYPVLVEKAAYFRDISGIVSWMGHYQVVTGYDENRQVFIAQDSFTTPDAEVPYETMTTNWRAFNNTYIIVFPPEKETEVLGLLGADADENSNYQNAAQRAADEIYAFPGIDQFYAWFNRGTNLMYLQDYVGAAQAYDKAFEVYPTIPENERPWRMLWYQTGPYFAYFYSGRYWDVLNLATTTLDAMQSDKNLEESYYWRGMAKNALGDSAGAITDFQTSLKYHPGFEPAIFQLQQLGVSP
jgi:hypothetical protein